MGLDLSLDKCLGPCQVLSWTGTTFNTIEIWMKIDSDKIEETL